MPQAATIKSLPHAFRMMKAMQAQGIEWGEDYRRAAGDALKTVAKVELEMDGAIAVLAGVEEVVAVDDAAGPAEALDDLVQRLRRVEREAAA